MSGKSMLKQNPSSPKLVLGTLAGTETVATMATEEADATAEAPSTLVTEVVG